MADPLDMFGADPFALPEIPADWRDTHVDAPPVDLAPVPEPLAPAPSAVDPAPPVAAPLPLDAAQPGLEPKPDLAPAPAPEPQFPPPHWTELDAISGGQVDLAPPAEAAPGPDPLAPQPTVQDEASALVEQGGLAVAKSGVERQAEADRVFAEREAEAREIAHRAQKTKIDVYERRNRELVAEQNDLRTQSKELATKGVDNNHWMETRSAGQTIAAFISAIAGGILNPRGKNSGLDTILNFINQDIETQKANLAHQREMLGQRRSIMAELFAENGDALKSAEIVRLATLESVMGVLKAERAKFDPRSSTVQKLAEVEVLWQQQQSAAQAKADAELHKRKLDEAELELKERTQAETVRNNKSQNALGWSNQKLARERFEHEKTVVSPQDEAAALKLAQDRRADSVVAPDGTVLGKPKVAANAQAIIDAGVAHAKYRKLMARIADLVERDGSAYKGLGSDRWPSELKTQISELREEGAVLLAKARDPVGAVSDKAIDAARKNIPDVDGWTSSKNPRVVYETNVKTADDAYDTYLEHNVVDFKRDKSPTRQYQAADKVLLSRDVDAQPRADIIRETTAPLWSGLTPDEKASAIERRRAGYTSLGDRGGGMTPDEFKTALDALEADRASGALSTEEYIALKSKLQATGLVRGTGETAANSGPGGGFVTGGAFGPQVNR